MILLIILSELFLVFWFIYAFGQMDDSGHKTILKICVVLVELAKLWYWLVGLLNYNVFHLVTDFMLLQLMVASCYKIKQIGKVRLGLGILLLVILAVWMFYDGGIIGPQSYQISDAGGFTHPGNYKIYRWSMYASEVIMPFALIFNLLISPFWKREYEADEEA